MSCVEFDDASQLAMVPASLSSEVQTRSVTKKSSTSVKNRSVVFGSSPASSAWSSRGAPTPMRCRGYGSGLTVPTSVPTAVMSWYSSRV